MNYYRAWYFIKFNYIQSRIEYYRQCVKFMVFAAPESLVWYTVSNKKHFFRILYSNKWWCVWWFWIESIASWYNRILHFAYKLDSRLIYKSILHNIRSNRPMLQTYISIYTQRYHYYVNYPGRQLTLWTNKFKL